MKHHPCFTRGKQFIHDVMHLCDIGDAYMVAQALSLRTPDPVINRAFAFAKLRAAESVFRTAGGLMHCPEGGAFYAAVWANDQAEYAGPFFPYLGDERAIEASRNCYRLFKRYMGPGYEPIPSSIIAQGQDIWEGGDRGDAAMVGYGAAKFALLLGEEAFAREIYPVVKWCMAYCRQMRTGDGVIASDSDELEGRFESGKTNLSTSCLTLGGLGFAAALARDLGFLEDAREYEAWALELARAIETYFGAEVNGYQTYRYYEGNTKLRAWICLPLVVGLMGRKAGTVDALLSPALWTANGLASEEGDTTFWDRSTLYGLRGLFMAGEADRAMPYLEQYILKRTLGEHVPYAVGAWPEGDQRHLSAESALLCLVFLEGVLGLLPCGLHAVSIAPHLPSKWPEVALGNVHLCGKVMDLALRRNESGIVQVDFFCPADGARRTYDLRPGERIVVEV